MREENRKAKLVPAPHVEETNESDNKNKVIFKQSEKDKCQS